MSLRLLTPWLLLALSLSVAAMVHGAGRGDRLISALSAGLFAASVVVTALTLNASTWLQRDRTLLNDEVKVAIACNVWLAAIIYAWGASALFGIYSLSDLEWRHAWQYGLGAAAFGAGLMFYARKLDDDRNNSVPPLYLTALHGLAASTGVIYLVVAGKLATLRPDWPANQVFLAGGLAIVALCIIAAVTQTRGGRRY